MRIPDFNESFLILKRQLIAKDLNGRLGNQLQLHRKLLYMIMHIKSKGDFLFLNQKDLAQDD